MTIHSETLLHRVKRLYTELFLSALHERMNSYHAFMDSHHHSEISDVLHDLIDETVKEAGNTHSVLDYKDMKFLDDEMASASNNLNYITHHSTNSDSKKTNNLSSHLTRKNAQGNEEHIAGKLQRSVWEHVHAAHRFARSGDGETAKLHADLATSAMKALSHYMPADECSDFLTEISSQLQSLRTGSAQESGSVSNKH